MHPLSTLCMYVKHHQSLTTQPCKPLILTGTEEEILADFRRVRDLIRQRMYAYAKEIFEGKDINSFKA